MLDLTIYLIKKINSKKSFDSYIKEQYLENSKLSKYYINKEYLIDSQNTRGKIYVFEEDNYKVPWSETINKIAKTRKRIIKKRQGKIKALILFEIENRIFAVSFSNGISLIKEDQLENNFGIKTNRKMIDTEKLKSIKSVTLSEGVISNHRSAKKNIPHHYQLDHAPLSVVSNLKGTIQNEIMSGFNITVSGQNQIQLKVSEEIEFLPQLVRALNLLLEIYQDEENFSDNFHWHNEIKREKNSDIIKKLEDILAKKIKKMIEKVDSSKINTLSKSTLSNIQFYPDIPDSEETPVLGFNVSGIGYTGTAILEKLDEVQIFSRLAVFLNNKNGKEWQLEKIITKLKTDNVYYFLEESEPIYLSKLYNSFYFQTSLLNDTESKYVLFQGKWYEVPIDFYSYIERTINSISDDRLGVDYIDFTNNHTSMRNGKIVSSEGAYNKDMSIKSELVLFDTKNYSITPDNARKYKLVPGSAVEPCDILDYSNGKIQLIHVKKGRSSSGISHLLSQAYVSSMLYKKDPEFLTHLNQISEDQNHGTIDFSNINNKDVVVVLACIVEPDYMTKLNSKTFPLLTAVSIIKTVSEIKDLGFDCRLIKIPNKYK